MNPAEMRSAGIQDKDGRGREALSRRNEATAQCRKKKRLQNQSNIGRRARGVRMDPERLAPGDDCGSSTALRHARVYTSRNALLTPSRRVVRRPRCLAVTSTTARVRGRLARNPSRGMFADRRAPRPSSRAPQSFYQEPLMLYADGAYYRLAPLPVEARRCI